MTSHDESLTENEALDEAARPGRAVLLTQVASAQALAATCSLQRLDAVAVPSDIGAFIVTDTLVGPQITATLSKALPHAQFLLLTVRDDRLTAAKWSNGQQAEDVPAALILDALPSEVENILLGTIDVSDLVGGVASRTLTRWKAMRTLAKAARQARQRSQQA